TPPALGSVAITSTEGKPRFGPPAPLLELAQPWTALQQLFGLLTSGTDSPQTPLPNVLPAVTTNPQAQQAFTPKDIGAGLLLFLSALRGGSFKNWLGKDNIKRLEDMGQKGLITRAEAEFNAIATQHAEAKPGHWQALFFPVAVDGVPQQVRLFTKRDRERGKDQPPRESEDTRFVIEVDLTQLGELQMDGFVRKGKDIHFDLVIRSLIPLDTQVQQDILAIYNASGAISGFKGGLSFQAVKDFPVNPMEDIVAHMNTLTA
ncbi:MAG: hypothetical protein K2Q01_08955, partial [Rickettsiales bacterium]|nr:hypothetical protein [Rickettsiales bacterium]